MTGVDALLRMLPTLAVIVGALLLLRHWAQKGRGSSSTPMRVVSRTGIGKGSVVAVVEVGGRRLLVGAAEQGVSLLTELDEEPVEVAATSAPAASASDRLALAPTTAPPPTTEPPATPGSSPAAPATDRQRLLDQLRQGASGPTGATRSSTPPVHPGRPRMAPLDRLRHMTVRTPVANRPSRPNRVHPRP